MPVHRAIFRVDFSLNYAIVDGAGRVMRVLSDAVDDGYWDALKDVQKDRTIAVSASQGEGDDAYARSFVVAPNAFVFSVEKLKGVKSNRLLIEDDFSCLVRLASKLCDEFHIQDVRRAGLRLWNYGNIVENQDALGVFSGLVDQKLLAAVSKGVGPVADVGVAFDGGTDSHAKYHVALGPYFTREAESRGLFEVIGQKFSQNQDLNFRLDVDLYEENFSLKGRSLTSWLKYQIDTHSELVERVSKVTGGANL